MSIVLGGYTIDGNGQRHQLPVISGPDDSAIEQALLSIKQTSGTIVLRHQPEPETGPYELVLYSDNGNYLLMLNEYADNGDTNVRTLTDVGIGNGSISILGESYPASAVTRDFQIIYSAFNEFARSGDVSGQALR